MRDICAKNVKSCVTAVSVERVLAMSKVMSTLVAPGASV